MALKCMVATAIVRLVLPHNISRVVRADPASQSDIMPNTAPNRMAAITISMCQLITPGTLIADMPVKCMAEIPSPTIKPPTTRDKTGCGPRNDAIAKPTLVAAMAITSETAVKTGS